MYIDFKPNRIIQILDSGDFFEFTAIVDPVSDEKTGIGKNTFVTQKNTIFDYSVLRINDSVLLRCFLHKNAKISVMDFKDYEINASAKENPYVCQNEKIDPVEFSAVEIINNITSGYPARIRGYVIRNTLMKPADGMNAENPIITVEVNYVDFFKRDASLEGLGYKEVIDAFAKKQGIFLSEKERKECEGQ